MLLVPLLVVTGLSGSGKTTLVAGIVKYLAARGYKIGVIKHSHHYFSLDEEGKDTWKFSQAGASITCLAADDKSIYIIKDGHNSRDPEKLLSNFHGMDLVLAEGYKGWSSNKTNVIEVIKENQEERICKKPLAVVRINCLNHNLPTENALCFNRNDVAEISAFVEETIILKEGKPLV